MPKRYHCEFKGCKCYKFKKHCNNLCLHCNHANIWHSLKKNEMTTPAQSHSGQLAFVSSRAMANAPRYERINVAVEIFEPIADDIPVAQEVVYCTDIDILPV